MGQVTNQGVIVLGDIFGGIVVRSDVNQGGMCGRSASLPPFLQMNFLVKSLFISLGMMGVTSLLSVNFCSEELNAHLPRKPLMNAYERALRTIR